ncbi:hypothetical protein Adu01nite_41600 [Paractinoplanes durhamensis]|uniref:Uncharacterized protein n=1 Tax=Paractinoplanes durhamensis TaxID=113563 RepID=A0ABQ3YZ02_9ACTN|nr:hypothetical protein Adu01nite_41600 [Actinoplanes durhamensis]
MPCSSKAAERSFARLQGISRGVDPQGRARYGEEDLRSALDGGLPALAAAVRQIYELTAEDYAARDYLRG